MRSLLLCLILTSQCLPARTVDKKKREEESDKEVRDNTNLHAMFIISSQI